MILNLLHRQGLEIHRRVDPGFVVDQRVEAMGRLGTKRDPPVEGPMQLQEL